MHIPDGLLSPAAAVGGYLVAGAVTWYSLRKLREQPEPEAQIPKAALLTAAFFVASWIHIPVPPTSVHLVLNGLMGVVLGWYAFPAILVGLFLQAIMFQHGGLTTLGVNASMMGLPALVAWLIFRMRYRFKLTTPIYTTIFGFLGGAVGLGLGALIAFTILITSIPTYIDAATEQTAIMSLTLAHIPLAIIEGVFTVLIVGFLLRVRPELVDSYAPAH
jgi:cobalt/nickel transport system permease protein